uniref:Uncharacterized protein n=1 Tax=Neolamprologus brichardi TaxID=32507 RepID=A0A3Q4HBK6_NEOBR
MSSYDSPLLCFRFLPHVSETKLCNIVTSCEAVGVCGHGVVLSLSSSFFIAPPPSLSAPNFCPISCRSNKKKAIIL